MRPPPELPGFLSALAPVLDRWGYLAVGALVLLEDFGVPVPGETVLIAAAVYAGAGHLNIAVVIVVGFLAAVIGDSIGYAIGRFGGRRLVLRYGKYVFITPKRLDAAERFFARHGGKIVTVARFVEGLRQANGIIAGISGMRWRTFVAFNALGALLWVGLWSSLGYLAGDHITTIWATIRRYQPYFYGALGLLVVALVVWHLRRRRRERSRDEPAASPAVPAAPASPGTPGSPASLDRPASPAPQDQPASPGRPDQAAPPADRV